MLWLNIVEQLFCCCKLCPNLSVAMNHPRIYVFLYSYQHHHRVSNQMNCKWLCVILPINEKKVRINNLFASAYKHLIFICWVTGHYSFIAMVWH